MLSSIGKTHIFNNVLLVKPWLVLIVTTRIISSAPGCVSSGQNIEGVFSFFISTIVPNFIFVLSARFQLERCCNWDMYSCDHLDKNSVLIVWLTDNAINDLRIFLWRHALVVRAFPMIKCSGVNACKSVGSLDIGVSDLEFKHASICTKTV